MSQRPQRTQPPRPAGKPVVLYTVSALVVIVALIALLDATATDDAPDGPVPVVAALQAVPASAPMIVDGPHEPSALVAPPPSAAPAPIRAEDAVALQHMEQLFAIQRNTPLPLGLRILDGAGEPAADARIEVWSDLDALDARMPGPTAVAWTDGLGHADLTLPRRGSVLFAAATGLGTTGIWSAAGLKRSVDESGETVLTLRPDATLTVNVAHASDRPAGFATVVFRRADATEGTGRVPASVTTDANGRATLSVDGHTELRAFAMLDDLGSHPVRVSAAPGATVDVTLRFPGRWSVTARLQDPEGEPAPGGLVEAWLRFPDHDVAAGDFPEADGFHVESTPDDAGVTVIALPRPGEYTLLGTRTGDAPTGAAHVFVDDASPHAQAVLRLMPAGTIAGRVVRGDNSPIGGLRVQARPAHLFLEESEAYAPTVWRLHGSAEIETDEDGAFTLGPLHPDGRYVVFCRPVEDRPDLKIVRKDVRTGTHDLLLVASDETLRRATLDGLVVADATGSAVDTFRARLVIELDGRVIETEDRPILSEAGRFRFEGLAPDYRYRLRIDAPDHGSVELPWFVADRRGRTESIRLPAVGRLEVTVVDRTSRPLEHVEVTAVRRSADFGTDRVSGGRTALDGRALLQTIPPDRYEITVRLGDVSASAWTTVEPGQRAEIGLQLDV